MSFILKFFGSLSLVVILVMSSSIQAAKTPQSASRIAAIVNNDIITVSDVEARTNLFILTSGIKNDGDKSKLRSLVLQNLIFERIQHQAADSNGIKVSDDIVDKAVKGIALNNNSTVEKMAEYFANQNIAFEVFKEMIRTQLAWVEYVRTQHGYSTQVSEAEIQTAMNEIKSRSGQSQFSYVEVFLPVDSPHLEASVRQNAEKIAGQMRSGANAEAVARQFSQSANASNGGKISLTSESSLDPALTSVLKRTNIDGIAGPVRIPGGFVVAKLLGNHFAGEADPRETEVRFVQVGFSIKDNISEEESAQIAAYVEDFQKIRGEIAFKKYAEERGIKTMVNTTKLGQLSPNFIPLVQKTAPGHCLPPVRTEEGIILMMPCAFKKAEFKLPTEDEVGQMLQEKKISKQAQRDRMRLYSEAFIDIKNKPESAPKD